MQVRHPGMHQLTDVTLKGCVRELRGIGASAHLDFALAQMIIMNSLGPDFWAKECTTFGSKQPFMAAKSDVRIIHIAHMIWTLRHAPGFEVFLSKNDANDFESTYYELFAAHSLLASSSAVEFVIPSGRRGADFDLKLLGYNGTDCLNVEVKARRRAFHTEKQVADFLASHRTQLPANEAGGIFCKLEAADSVLSPEATTRAAHAYLQRTSRIKYAFFCYDAATSDRAIALAGVAVEKSGATTPLMPGSGTPLVPSYLIAAGVAYPS